MQAQAAPGWDVGELPTVRMPYMEYPLYTHSDLRHRDQEITHATTTRAAILEQEARRMQRRSETGWASTRRGAYRPLGTPDLTLPPTGTEVRQKQDTARAMSKPRLVRPEERKKANRAEKEDEVEKLELGMPVLGSVNQFCYHYYEVRLPTRVNLRIEVKQISGDPDIFVSNDNPTPTMDDWMWRSGATGDDEVFIETDHPKYVVGTYYIAVYSIYDSRYEIVASLSEVPLATTLRAVDGGTGNGYDTLSQLVSEAEARRRLCALGAAVVHERPPPRDPASLYYRLPPHLKHELGPADDQSAPAALTPQGSGEGAPPSAASPAKRPSVQPPPETPRQTSFAAPPSSKPTVFPVSVLTTPYLSEAYFGQGMTPRLGGPKGGAAVAAEAAAVAAAAAATAATAATGSGGGGRRTSSLDERSLVASHMSSAAAPPPPPTPPALHPWLPSGHEPSLQTEVEVVAQRAPTDLTPQVMQIRHSAMKEDMSTQMRRIAHAVTSERAIITHIKQVALDRALRAAEGNPAPPLSSDPTDALRAMRLQAQALRQVTLQQLQQVAKAESERLVQTGAKGNRRLSYASPRRGSVGGDGGERVTRRASPVGDALGLAALGLGAPATAALASGGLFASPPPPPQPTRKGGGTNGHAKAAESARGRGGADARPDAGSPRGSRTGGKLSPSQGVPAEGAGALPLLPMTARARLEGGGGAGAGAMAEAADGRDRCSATYPVHLPQLQPSSPGRRAREATGLATSGPGAVAVTAEVAPALAAPAAATLDGAPLDMILDAVVPPTLEIALTDSPRAPDGGKQGGHTPRSGRKPVGAGGDAAEADSGVGQRASRRHLHRSKQPAKVWGTGRA